MTRTARAAHFATDVANRASEVFSSPRVKSLPAIEQTEDGRRVVRGLKIFRTGKLTDSAGRQREWGSDELDKMVDHFARLTDSGEFPDVPVRADHSISVKDVAGYHTSLRRDGNFLVADVEFTEPEAAEKYARGTWRSRSVEIGTFRTEAGEELFPVVMGTAFVDIPAVSGLYRAPDSETTEEIPVKFRIAGAEIEDAEAVQAHIDSLEAFKAAAPEVHTFRVDGTETTDPEAVQARIDALEAFQNEQVVAARESFVDGLAADRKIGAPQVDALKEFAKGLSPEQFETFRASYDAAPTLSLFDRHASGTPVEGEPGAASSEIDALRETVAMHRMTLSTEALHRTPSYQRLKALDPTTV